MPILYPGVQYSGIWTLQQAHDAIAASNWPSPPVPLLYSWGQNTDGQLGLGNTTGYSSPKQVGSLTTWSSIGGLNTGVLAVKSDGTLWAWGKGQFGQLGLGNTTSYSSPKQVGALTNWLKVAACYGYCYAVKTDGTLWSWGRGTYGTLGLGNTTYYSSPKQVGSLTNWLDVVSGSYASSFAIKTDGTMWAWGYGAAGGLGLNNATNYSSPKQLGALTNWSSATGAAFSTIAITTSGILYAWGSGGAGQLGLGNLTNYSSPKQVGALTNWSKTSTASTSCFSIKTDGSIWSWGGNNSGLLGDGTLTSRSSPVQIGALTNWLYFSAAGYGASHIGSIKTDGTLWVWGSGSVGQLGLGNTTNYSSPKQVGSLTTWQYSARAGGSTLAIALI